MTGRAAGLLLLVVAFAVAGDVAGWQLLSQLAMAFLALLVLSFIWTRWSISGLEVGRSVSPSRLQVGEVLSDTMTLRSSSQLGKLWIEARDRCEVPAHNASRVVGLSRKGNESWATRSVCVRRGSFALGPVELRTGDPLGIFIATKRLPVRGEVIVYPPVFDLPAMRLPFADAQGRRELERKALMTTPSVSTVRDYVPGDPLSKIAWSVTARTGKLMVKEFDLDPSSEVWVMADFGFDTRVLAERTLVADRGKRFDVAEAWIDSSEDLVAALGASVIRVALDHKRSIGYIGGSAIRRVVQADSSERQYHHILEELALARSDGREQIADVIASESRRFDRNRTPVVVTASLDPRWLKALEGLTTRGVRPIAIFVDPGSLSSSIDSSAFLQHTLDQRFPVFVVDFGDGIAEAFSLESRIARAEEAPRHQLEFASV
ncbi:DUF58 domain-containing protein [soil metagenome]